MNLQERFAKSKCDFLQKRRKNWRARWDLNPGPPAPQASVIIRTRLRAPQHGFCWITTLAVLLLKFPEKANALLLHYVFESVFDELFCFLACEGFFAYVASVGVVS